MEEYKQRMLIEEMDINEKKEKLSDFMHTETFGKLAAVDQGLRMVQLVAMNNYSDALARQIELF